MHQFPIINQGHSDLIKTFLKKTLSLFGGDDVAQPAQNRSVIIEFRVEDVDKDYERLADYLQDKVVQKPTTMPWGNKSLLFRDPDGNLVNFFTPVTPEAIAKFDGHSIT